MSRDRGVITSSQEYQSFRSTVPKRKVVVHYRGKEYVWCMYDCGSKDDPAPILFLPPVSCKSEVFFRQLIDISTLGHRCISVDYPVIWNVNDFLAITVLFLEQLGITSVHLVGGSLGAYLAQKIAEYTYKTPTVKSMVLINGFTDTTVFKSAPSPLMIPLLPAFVLRQLLLSNFPSSAQQADVADSLDFVAEMMSTFTQKELASRFSLNVKPSYVEPQRIFQQDIKVMIVEVYDKSALSSSVRSELRKYYSDAKIAHMKHGGNFPYLASSLELNMYLKIHMRQFDPEAQTASDATDAGSDAEKEEEEEEDASDNNHTPAEESSL